MPKIGQRKTQQREQILDIITQAEGPLSVDEILKGSNDAGIQVGIATIYRTVKLLLENKMICQVILPDGQSRYETVKSADHHHHHLHCNSCDRVIDIHKCCEHLRETEVEGHLIQRHEITLFGICQDCRKK
ncbi:MAG: transcriptional repressor [Lentisphaeraceae bacterium]|nr:transcriptional repressor [Lentisphaeraceae bacterium]